MVHVTNSNCQYFLESTLITLKIREFANTKVSGGSSEEFVFSCNKYLYDSHLHKNISCNYKIVEKYGGKKQIHKNFNIFTN